MVLQWGDVFSELILRVRISKCSIIYITINTNIFDLLFNQLA